MPPRQTGPDIRPVTQARAGTCHLSATRPRPSGRGDLAGHPKSGGRRVYWQLTGSKLVGRPRRAPAIGAAAAAVDRRPFILTALAVHGVMTGVLDRRHNAVLNGFDIVAPDGQPVRWALNLVHGARLRDWVSGPDLALRVLRRA